MGLRKIELCNKLSLTQACDGTLPKSGLLTKTWAAMNASHPAVETRLRKLSSLARKQGVDEARIQDALTRELTIAPENYLAPATLRKLIAPAAIY